MRRFILAGLGIFLIIVLFIWFLASRGNRPQQDLGVQRSALTDYALTATEVRYTLEGEINARENHRSVQIIVGQSTRTITVFEGYQGKVLKSETYLNDSDAYRAFLAGLENSGYTKSRVATRNVDPLAACPTGKRYRYDIINGSDVKQSLWSASCNGTRGTFNGNTSNVQNLFEAQVPDYDAFVDNIRF